MKKLKKLTIFSMIIVFIFVGCKNNDTIPIKTLRLAVSKEISTLNSLTVIDADSAQVIGNFMEGLITYSPQGDIIGGIAEDWKVSADGLVYTFNLREAKWQDEVPVTAKDFVFAWQSLVTMPSAPYRDLLRNFVNATEIMKKEKPAAELGVKAVNNRKLEITLTQPVAYLLELLAFPAFFPVREDFYKQVGPDNYGTSQATVLANGPFLVSEYNGDTGYVLTKNIHYWDVASVDVQEVNVRVVKQAATRANLYEAGEIDQLVLTADLHDKYAAYPELVSETQPRMNYIYLSKNVDPNNSVLVSYNMRAAIAHAIDKELLVSAVVKDGSIPADYFIPRGFFTLDDQDFRNYSGAYNTLSYDAEKAREFFEKAKYELAGKKLEVTISLPDTEHKKKIFENVKAQLETNLPGLTVNLSPYPQATYFSTLQQHKIPAANFGWLGTFRDPVTFFDVFQTGKLQNYGAYSNVMYDKLIEDSESKNFALNPQKRWDAFVQAEKILLADCYLIPLYQHGQKSLIKENVHNLKLNATIPFIFYKYVRIDT